MHQKLLKILGFVLCGLVLQISAKASIIVSFKDLTVYNSTTASFEVYAAADSGTQLVGGYGFQITINNSPGSLSATQVASLPVVVPAQATQWSGLSNSGPQVTANTVTFVGTNNPPSIGNTTTQINVNIGSGQSSNTLIGTVSFSRNVLTTYSISSSPFSYNTAGSSVSGFVNITSSGPDGLGNFTNTPASIGSNASTAVGTITAVPEPSTMALVGFALVGFGLKRLRSNRKRQAK